MKKSFLAFLLLVTLMATSCSTYYLSTVESSDETLKNRGSGNFVVENDSLRITYNFFGQGAPVNVEIYNKLDEPLYIDWQRSSLIIDDYATSYMGDKVYIQGSTGSFHSGYIIGDDWTGGRSLGFIDAVATLPRGMDFIPPRTHIKRVKLYLPTGFYKKISNSSYENQNFVGLDGYLNTVGVSRFSDRDSPLTFKSYLTLYALDEESNQPRSFSFGHEFFVAEVMKMRSSKPDNLLKYRERHGDIFMLKRIKGWGAGLLIGTAALVVASVALADDEETE